MEVFEVASWSEHLRQHDGRLTGYDVELLERARRLADQEPTARHLLPPP
ncbi:MFS transporter [Streptacidiphilus albus]|nr:MFS transporter [Streptacidiphilus albus]